MRVRWIAALAALAGTLVLPAWPGTPTTAAPTPVVVIGDSLTAGNLSTIRQTFADVELGASAFDALSGRNIIQSITYSWGFVPSGVAAATAARAAGIDAPLWVVQLGANNVSMISRCDCDRMALARSMIDAMRAAVGSRPVAWVNVRATTFTDAVDIFNQALRDEASDDPTFRVIDWFAYSAGKDWFTDHVHPNVEGARALATCMAASAAWILGQRPGVATSTTVPPTTVPATTSTVGTPDGSSSIDGAATAVRPATRLGAVAAPGLPSCDALS